MQHVRRFPWSSWLALLVTLLRLSDPGQVRAQSTSLVLTVQIRSTVADAPLPHIAVSVINAASNHPLAQGMTDWRGRVSFPQMLPTAVRVRLSGRLPDGTSLRPTPQDVAGIWVRLPGHDWLMDLRVDTDGLVFPDLAGSAAGAPDAQDGSAVHGGSALATSAGAYPTAAVAHDAAQQTAMPLADHAAPTSGGEATESHAAAPSQANVLGALLLALLLGLMGGVLWLTIRRKL